MCLSFVANSPNTSIAPVQSPCNGPPMSDKVPPALCSTLVYSDLGFAEAYFLEGY